MTSLAGNPPFLMPCTPIFFPGQVKLTVAEGMSPASSTSAVGQLETFSTLSRMSAFGGKAEADFGRLDVCS